MWRRGRPVAHDPRAHSNAVGAHVALADGVLGIRLDGRRRAVVEKRRHACVAQGQRLELREERTDKENRGEAEWWQETEGVNTGTLQQPAGLSERVTIIS